MTAFEALGLVGGLASIAGFVYAIYLARASVRRKVLAYDVTPPVALATVLQPDDTHHLAVVYQRDDQPEERITSAYIRFLRFANFGREPIRREDIASASPLRISVRGARTLEISLVGAKREVSRIAVSSMEEVPDGIASRVSFDFIDEGDGGIVRIVTAEEPGLVALEGHVIGMPEGVKRAEDLRKHGALTVIGCTLGAVIQLGAIIITLFVYKWVMGGWQDVWIMALPLVALILPGVIFAVIASTVWPQSGVPFPKELTPPRWFHSRLSMYGHRQVHPFELDELSLKALREEGAVANTSKKESAQR
jgi:hypothetical protein